LNLKRIQKSKKPTDKEYALSKLVPLKEDQIWIQSNKNVTSNHELLIVGKSDLFKMYPPSLQYAFHYIIPPPLKKEK